MKIIHSIITDGLPRDFIFQYETTSEAKKLPEAQVFVLVTQDEKRAHFHVEGISGLWLMDKLIEVHGKGVVGGGASFTSAFVSLEGVHQYLFPV